MRYSIKVSFKINLIKIGNAVRDFLISTYLRIKGKISSLEPANQKVDAALLTTVLAITLPMDAFVYWRLICESFDLNILPFIFQWIMLPIFYIIREHLTGT